MNLQDQLNQKLNRKFGEDRLKIKIDFSPEQNAIDYYKNEENYITFESKYEVGIAIGFLNNTIIFRLGCTCDCEVSLEKKLKVKKTLCSQDRPIR